MNDHDKLRALVAGATPLPWRWSENGNIVPDGYPDAPGKDIEIAAVYTEEDDDEPGNSKLIVAAVNALPGLLDEIERLKAALAALGGKGEARDWTEDFAHENGQYSNRCVTCGEMFAGYKRRVTCRLCSTQPEAQGEAVAWWEVTAKPTWDESEPAETFVIPGPNKPTNVQTPGLKLVKVRPLIYGDTAAPKPVEGVTEPWYGHRFCKGRDGRWRCADGCGPALVEEAHQGAADGR